MLQGGLSGHGTPGFPPIRESETGFSPRTAAETGFSPRTSAETGFPHSRSGHRTDILDKVKGEKVQLK